MSDKKIKNSFIEGPILPQFITNSIARHQSMTAIGGHSIFLGQIRTDTVNDQVVRAMEFTAYKELAEESIAAIREDIFAKYSIHCMHVYHSLGTVTAGEICFFVFSSAAHRKAAIDSCNEMVERFKKEVPLWGKELFDDGTHSWKENK